MIRKLLWIVVAAMAIMIGLYPSIYFIFDRTFGLLNSKSNEVLTNLPWNFGFYTHIILGGIALLIGWTQFSSRIRNNRLSLHRMIGKAYVVCALLSALAAVFISFYATGGVVTSAGFFCLGVVWFFTTLTAYNRIKSKKIQDHEKMMIYSYSACFAAVTLRIWLPLLTMTFHDFLIAYKIVAWLCWVPNIIVAYFIVKNVDKKQTIIAL